jgi:short-subunit dehydrogenase
MTDRDGGRGERAARRPGWAARLSAAVALGLALAGCAAPGALGARDQALLAGRVYVITGASSGLGRGVALRLGAHGAHVVLAARRGAVLEEVAAEVRAAGGQALAVPTDVAIPEEVTRLAEAAVGHFGRIDVWINNTGVGAIGRFEAVPVADHARIVDVNLKGVIYGSHAALRQFHRQGSGTLVNIASVEGHVPAPYHSTYGATKHAVVGLGRSLHQELRLAGAKDIHVATVLPWALDTPWWGRAANYSGHSPRMALMDGTEQTVAAIVWVSLHPRKEYAVGWKAEIAVLGHRALPGLSEWGAANVVHASQMVAAPPAADTPGSLHVPGPGGTGVEDGVRARIAREDAERAAAGR